VLRHWPLSESARTGEPRGRQDPRWILGEQALADAGKLAAASELGDLDAAYILGMFYWYGAVDGALAGVCNQASPRSRKMPTAAPHVSQYGSSSRT
jgi:hypothetical protein